MDTVEAKSITVHRDGKNYGPYTLEQANSLLACGKLVPADQAWQDGAYEWAPLESIPGIIGIPPTPAPSPSAPATNSGWVQRVRRALTPLTIGLMTCSVLLPLFGGAVSVLLRREDGSPGTSLIVGLAGLVSGAGFACSIACLIFGIFRLFKREKRDQGILLVGFYLLFALMLKALE